MPTRVLIMGAAGKDFHVFNTLYRNSEDARVVAITATQIPGIENRKYPPELAGPLYPDGIPIEPEASLEELIKDRSVDTVIFAYSDVSYDYVDACRRRAETAGASFMTAPTREVMLKSRKPAIAVCAVRTGSGKSQTSRYVVKLLAELGKKAVAIRHPMPYGDLVKQRVQRFATIDDLKAQNCTIEEMEEYEPYLRNGLVVFAGVDYQAILAEAEKEADVVLWDGGNNDIPFVKPDLHITLVDPHRPGHELSYYPGRENLELAHVVLFNKMDSADPANVKIVEANVKKLNPKAKRIYCNSPVTVDDPSLLEGARVLAVEDGPTLTHGEMTYGAAVLAAKRYGAREIVDPRPYTVGTLTGTFKKYPGIGHLLPAMGYGKQQIHDLEETINRCECDAVAIGTPIDLGRIIKINKPHTRVRYELEEVSGPKLRDLIKEVVG
jgi:predicted GTPase